MTFDLFRIGTTEGKKRSVADELNEVQSALKNAQNRFENASDFDLLEATIYEINALNAQYRFLLKKAKEHEVQNHKAV